MDKGELRREMRARRKALSAEERAARSAAICGRLASKTETAGVGEGSVVAVYLASTDEIDLGAYIERLFRLGCRVVAPRWNGVTYELAVLKGLESRHLRRGPMGIMEPADAETVAAKEVSVWIVPGLAFTCDGQRIGYGGGWYDRFLSAASHGALKLGVAFSFQLVDSLPVEPHDVPLTAVISDSAGDFAN